jgi:hypothetical protein
MVQVGGDPKLLNHDQQIRGRIIKQHGDSSASAERFALEWLRQLAGESVRAKRQQFIPEMTFGQYLGVQQLNLAWPRSLGGQVRPLLHSRVIVIPCQHSSKNVLRHPMVTYVFLRQSEDQRIPHSDVAHHAIFTGSYVSNWNNQAFRRAGLSRMSESAFLP